METMKIETLKEIGNSNDTAKAVFSEWASRKRIRTELNVNRLIIKLAHKGKVVPEEVYETLKKLEDAGVGSLIHGRAGKEDRFKVYYSLKQIGTAVADPSSDNPIEKLSVPEKRGRGRPPSSKNKVKMKANGKSKGRGRPKGSKNKLYTIKLTASQMTQLKKLLD